VWVGARLAGVAWNILGLVGGRAHPNAPPSDTDRQRHRPKLPRVCGDVKRGSERKVPPGLMWGSASCSPAQPQTAP